MTKDKGKEIFEQPATGGSLDIDIPPSQVAETDRQPAPDSLTGINPGPRAEQPQGVSERPAPTVAAPPSASRFLNQGAENLAPAQHAAAPATAPPAAVQPKPDPATVRHPRVMDFVVVSIGPGKFRPAIVTNAIENRPELIDATIFLVPALDGGQTFAPAHNVEYDASGQGLDTWRWRN